MASRLSEVVYRLRDFFTEPTGRIVGSYRKIRGASKETSARVQRDTKKMADGFGKLSDTANKVLGFLGAGFTVSAAANSIGKVADELDRLGTSADLLDIDPSSVAGIEFAFDRSSVSIDKASAALQTLQKRTGEALGGFGRAKIAFEQLGISAEDFSNLNAEQQLVELANAIQGVSSEEERAAIASQLFSKANQDLVLVLNQGGPALQGLIDKGKAQLNVTREATDAAGAYKDALADLQTSIDRTKFDIATPIIQELAEFADNVGLGDPVKGLNTELLLLEKRLDKPFVLFRDDVEQRVGEIRRELSDLARAQERNEAAEREAIATAKEGVQVRQEQKEALKVFEQNVDSLTDAYKEQAKARSAALAQETSELRAARREQSSIEQEFTDLVKSVTEVEPSDVSLGDVFLADTQARAALAAGDIELAIDKAREGADLLGALKDKGTETQGTLGFLAEQLKKVATEAAGQKVDAEIIDEDQAKQAVANVKTQLEQLKTDAVKAGTEAGQALVTSLQAALSGTDIVGPLQARLQGLPEVVRTATAQTNAQLTAAGTQGGADYVAALQTQLATEVQAPAVSVPQIRRNGNSFSDGTDFREAVDRRGSR